MPAPPGPEKKPAKLPATIGLQLAPAQDALVPIGDVENMPLEKDVDPDIV